MALLSGPQTTTSTVTTPEYLRPYYDRALSRGEAAFTEPYKPYTGQLTAGLAPTETQAINAAANLQLPGQFQSAGNLYNAAASGIMGLAGFQPGTLTGGYNPTQFSSGYTAGTPTAGYNPTQFSSGYTAAPAADYNRFTDYQAGNIGSNYVAGQTTGGVFDGGAAQQYMSPYQQNVTDIAKREAERDFLKQQSQLRARAGAAGAFGGSRATLLETENQRNQNQLLDDIQTRGLQSAFTNAQEMFERDRQARLSAFGANEGARQAQAQLGLTGQQAQEQARRAAAELGLGALGQRERDRQAAATLDLDAQRLGDQSRQFGANNALDRFRAQEQARQTQATLGLDAQRLGDQSRQFADTSQINRFQTQEQARQNAAQLGMRGYESAANIAQGLGSLGAQIGSEARANIGTQLAAGSQQREQQQLNLNNQYRQFLEERGYPREQATQFASILASLGSGQRVGTETKPAAGNLEQILGLLSTGTGILGELGGVGGAQAGLGSLLGGIGSLFGGQTNTGGPSGPSGAQGSFDVGRFFGSIGSGLSSGLSSVGNYIDDLFGVDLF